MNVVAKLRSRAHEWSAFGVKHLWLFGSEARNEATPRDVDILVEFAKPPGLLDYMGLKFRLEELLERPVDVVSKAACRPNFLRRIEADLVDVA